MKRQPRIPANVLLVALSGAITASANTIVLIVMTLFGTAPSNALCVLRR
ncbi:hypothetical protein [Lentzea guizhouensis]|nr:hypothetical protein [Lentzea guizhouensis]